VAFTIYKRSQGKYTRLCSAFAVVLIVGLGCLRLYNILDASALDLSLWTATLVPVGLFAVLCVGAFWLVNKPSVADFMVSAEGEMKKVSWSSRKEIAVSTFIVVVVVALMAAFLGLVDLGFQLFFSELIGI